MKKLNKTETVAFAARVARTFPGVTAVTLQDLAGMNWTAREELAEGFAGQASVIAEGGGVSRADDFRVAFVTEAQKVWGALVRQHENAVRRFRTEAAGTPVDEAPAQVRALVESMRVRGMRPLSGSGMSVTVERAWGADGSVYFNFERDGEPLENPDVPGHTVQRFALTVKLSWGSTSRGIGDAVTAVKLYTELIEIASEVEATVGRERVVYVYGAPPVAAVPPLAEGMTHDGAEDLADLDAQGNSPAAIVHRGEDLDEACPGCGCKPGDGRTPGCTSPDGCGAL